MFVRTKIKREKVGRDYDVRPRATDKVDVPGEGVTAVGASRYGLRYSRAMASNAQHGYTAFPSPRKSNLSGPHFSDLIFKRKIRPTIREHR